MTTRRLFAFCACLACFIATNAQIMVNGTVIDSVTKTGLKMASVTLMRRGKPVTFTKTDVRGRFCLKAKSMENNDSLSVTYIGYGKRTMPIGGAKEITVEMTTEEFKLKEILVSGKPITNKADTVIYDLTRFADQRDNSLKDVLKKLPGVSVDKGGTISVNGKKINRFTVEGLDLTGGKYDKMNETLKAKDVKSAEVIEHDQPVKALQGKMYSDNVAMNINLKDEAKDKFLFNISPTALVHFPIKEVTAGGKADIMQIGRKRQQMYDIEYDRSGKDISMSHHRLATFSLSSQQAEAELPHWFDIPLPNAPIDNERLRFNNSHDWNFRTVKKNKRDGETRLSAGYMHTTEYRKTSNMTTYYIDEAQPTTTSEERNTHISNDRVQIDYDRSINEEKVYGNHYITARMSKTDGQSILNASEGDSVRQRVKSPEMNIQNTFSRMFVYNRHSFEIYSDAEFFFSPSRLTVNDMQESMNTSLFYTNNKMKWIRNRSFNTTAAEVGATVEHLYINGGKTHFSIYANPYHEIRRGRTTLRLSMPTAWECYADYKRSFVNTSPNISFNLNNRNRSDLYIYAAMSQNTGNLGDFAVKEYRSDYRTTIFNEGIIPRTTSMTSGIKYTYKRTVKEFFFNLKANYTRSWFNIMSDLQITEGKYVYKTVERKHHNSMFGMHGELSKGWFDLRLNTLLAIEYNNTRGQHLSGGKITGYESNKVSMKPSLVFSPSWCEVHYSASFAASRTKTDAVSLQTLWNWRQSLSLTKTIGNTDLSVSAVHYHNELQHSPTVNTLLANASIVWRTRKVRLLAELRNLFDSRQYTITSYGGVASSTGSYHLRPREIFVMAQISL